MSKDKDDNTPDMFGYDGLSSSDLDKIDQEEVQKHWPELLLQVYSTMRSELSIAGVDEEVAIRLLERLCETIGGTQVYFPRGDNLKAEMKAYRIWHDFNGRNVLELARKYNLTTPHVYAILAKMRKREKNKHQPTLF